MEKNIVRLNEEQIQQIVTESVKRILAEVNFNEENMEEGWLGDKWKQAKSAASSAKGLATNGITNTFKNMKSNWNTQGELNGLNDLRQKLEQFIDNGQLNPQMTIAQLVGGKYNSNKFGRLSGMQANRRSQISKKSGSSY